MTITHLSVFKTLKFWLELNYRANFVTFQVNCRQFGLTLARMLSIVTKFLNVIQPNQHRGKIIKGESCAGDQKFFAGSGIKILSEKMGSVMKKYTSLLP